MRELAARGGLWLVGDRFFVQAAIDASTGRETGRETTGSMRDPEPMLETRELSRSATSAEAFFRIGGAFAIDP